ncbi:MAG: hypothetical protein AB7O26_15005 [Planctomycetaceae bacterium]
MAFRQQILVALILMSLLGVSLLDSPKPASRDCNSRDFASAIEDAETRVELECCLDFTDGLTVMTVEPQSPHGYHDRVIQAGAESSQVLSTDGPDLSRAPPARS